jgi:hypothetical protein
MSFVDSHENQQRIPRRSSCANESRRYQLEQWAGTTVEERIHAALTMSRSFAWLKPTAKKEEHEQ